MSGLHPGPEINLRFVLNRKSSFALKGLTKSPDSSNLLCGHLSTNEVLPFLGLPRKQEVGCKVHEGGIQPQWPPSPLTSVSPPNKRILIMSPSIIGEDKSRQCTSFCSFIVTWKGTCASNTFPLYSRRRGLEPSQAVVFIMGSYLLILVLHIPTSK